MSNSTSSSSAGIGLPGLVFIVFLVMKLAHIGDVAKWSWWWVTSPLWGSLVFVAAFFILMIPVVLYKAYRKEKNNSARVRDMLNKYKQNGI